MSKLLRLDVFEMFKNYKKDVIVNRLSYDQIDVQKYGDVIPKKDVFCFDITTSFIKNFGEYLYKNMKDGEIFTVFSEDCSIIHKKPNSSDEILRCYSNKGTVEKYQNKLNDIFNSNEFLVLNKTILDTKNFAFRQHDDETNHWFDKGLGLKYSYHLQLVADIGLRFIELLPLELRVRALQGCYLHDSVEDARMTYRKLKDRFGGDVASDACRLCTNLGGHNREQRAGQWYYDKINESIVSVFIKFCDRIANIEHGILYNTSRKSYLLEMDGFLDALSLYDELEPMREHLRYLQARLQKLY